MTRFKEWYVVGNSFQMKDELKALGCKWNTDKKKWRTPAIESGEYTYNRINSIAKSVDCKLVLCEEYLSDQTKKIQEILHGKSR